MVVIGLFVRAELENASEVKVGPDHVWSLNLRESDGFEKRDNVTLTASELADTGNSRNSVNLCVNFKESRRKATITLRNVKDVTRDFFPYNNDYSCLVAFDCRGVDIMSWNPNGGYSVVCDSGNVIDDVTFEDGSWVGYDEKSGNCVSVLNLEYELKVIP
ncbi:hypothetical protein TpMuguga_02g00714 [Theileria parva strain Muguga]|uniref:Uncharacterized protein n=1 Tax=Theileria parva TaxID=5875 RepID=Q4N4C5_THEPA|nr:uncharacterized protein TpMuguga_02g00714 [Theileria parva strain Muguga]EAN32998.1 hypothetical protein TpMuguga_02g00714 [Theileria parva strain Muguga]|eukprot:XP_765281.1 hypothetical protein [Theileria parva strain Muguga]